MASDTALKKRDRVAWHSNEFLSAAYSMTRDEKRLLWLCMSTINPLSQSDQDHCFDITVKLYAEMFNIDATNASKDLMGAAKRLLTRSITIYRPDESTEEEVAEDEYPVLIKKSSRPKRGLYQLEINPHLMPFFRGLKREFTKLHLIDVADLRNPHAMRLYENLSQFRSTSTFHRRVEWFIERYALPASYRHYGLFKSKFLVPAIEEINKKTPLSVSFVEHKTGRKVTSIMFSFSRKEPAPGPIHA